MSISLYVAHQASTTKTHSLWRARGLSGLRPQPGLRSFQLSPTSCYRRAVTDKLLPTSCYRKAGYRKAGGLRRGNSWSGERRKRGFHARPFEPYPVPVLGAVFPLLERFRGHLSPKVIKIKIQKLTLVEVRRAWRGTGIERLSSTRKRASPKQRNSVPFRLHVLPGEDLTSSQYKHGLIAFCAKKLTTQRFYYYFYEKIVL